MKLFLCYAREPDERVVEELKRRFADRKDRIELWSDHRIGAGSQWGQEIEKAIDSSHGALLFMSEAFFDSEFINTVELPRILSRKPPFRIIPIRVTDVDWTGRHPELAKVQAIPRAPLTSNSGRTRQRAWDEIVRAVEDAVAHADINSVSFPEPYRDNPWGRPAEHNVPHPLRQPLMIGALIAAGLAALASFVELPLSYLRQSNMLIPPSKAIDPIKPPLVITFEPDDANLLDINERNCRFASQIKLPDIHSPTKAWRPIHACLVEALVVAHARVIVFDLSFDTTDPWLELALDHARSSSVAVVLAHGKGEHPPNTLYRRERAVCGIVEATEQFGRIRRIGLQGVDERASTSKCTPSIAVQAFALAASSDEGNIGIEAQSNCDGITRPMELAGEWLAWTRFSAERPETLRYSNAMRLASNAGTEGKDDLERKVRGRVVFIGAGGKYAESVDEYAIPGCGRIEKDQCSGTDYGVVIQAHVFNHFVAHRNRAIPEATRSTSILLFIAAFVFSAIFPILTADIIPPGSLQAGRVRRRDALFASFFAWPGVALIGPFLVIVAIAMNWSAEYFYPVLGVVLASLSGGIAAAWPARRMRKEASRLVWAMSRVQDDRIEAGFPPLFDVVPDRYLARMLSLPAFNLRRVVLTVAMLRMAYVQGRSPLLLRVPIAFFARAGWLESTGADSPSTNLRSAGELKPEFIGVKLWRTEGEPAYHVIRAIAGDGQSTAARSVACWTIQQQMCRDSIVYLEKLAEYLEMQSGRKRSVKHFISRISNG